MLVECQRCHAGFFVADELIRAGGAAVQCVGCGRVFRVSLADAGVPRQEVAPRPTVVECRRCATRFTAALPGGTAVQCTRCGFVFKTPAKRVGDDVVVAALAVPEPERSEVASLPTVDCPKCQTRFAADLPGGTAVTCTKCGKVFETPARAPVLAAPTTDQRADHLPPRAGPLMVPPKLPDALRELGSADPKRRRWFSSRAVDLIIWCDEHGAPSSFRFCYDKETRERAVTWSDGKFAHALVDSGERHEDLAYKQGAMLLSELEFDARRVLAVFEAFRHQVPSEFSRFVAEKLSTRVAGLPVPPVDGGPIN